ncbi:hypothetical protein [Natrialba taiwanensis]|uniref:Uncharacterized protein n=1 Tax=Natrialba taiwanensis DSM 12281 TaxID=1230458 RepID=M0ADD9_9EURY|nr:hypothetical protein [Natrialba taiwanensis]ELY96524.1 hypothetical protein C484_00825 [Natrialba taiwanensis DSM 12281]
MSGGARWQVAEGTGIGIGELWFDTVADGLTQRAAEDRARGVDNHVAIPEPTEMPEDWGEQFLNGELEDDPYAE